MNITSHESRRIAITYNLKRTALSEGFKNDDDAEFDSLQTLEAISSAIKALGHEVIVLEATATTARSFTRKQRGFSI